MRVGIDARPVQLQSTGDSTYWRGIIGELAGADPSVEFIIYLNGRHPVPEMPACKNYTLRILNAPSDRLWSIFAFPAALARDKVDLAHVQYTVPPSLPCPVVDTVHDVSFKRYPQFFRLKDRLILDWGTRLGSKKAARILTVSEFTKKEIVELYKVQPERVVVTPLAADTQFKPVNKATAQDTAAEKYGLRYPFILTLGVIQPRKNLPRLLHAFKNVKSTGRFPHKLVIVGKYGWRASEIGELITNLGIGADVVFTGYVPYEDLPILYSAADLFAYPSVYEGFGLPPLEAMACGTPVVTGNKTSLPEVVGDAGIMVDPYSTEALAEGISRVLLDKELRENLSQKGIDRASLFSWKYTAEKIFKTYMEAAGR